MYLSPLSPHHLQTKVQPGANRLQAVVGGVLHACSLPPQQQQREQPSTQRRQQQLALLAKQLRLALQRLLPCVHRSAPGMPLLLRTQASMGPGLAAEQPA
jgi:hypothetical protein